MAWGLSGGARGDQAGLVGEDNELRAVTRAELDHRPADVGLGGCGAERQIRDGELIITDGPYAETKEQIVGYDVL
jgi:hypothetical protein